MVIFLILIRVVVVEQAFMAVCIWLWKCVDFVHNYNSYLDIKNELTRYSVFRA